MMMMRGVALFCLLAMVHVFCQAGEKMLIAGCGWNKIAVLDKQTKKLEWEHALSPKEDCNDIEQTKEGHILYAYRGGARLINWNHEVLWDYKVQEGEEVYTATQLADGKYLVAVCGNPSRIVELDDAGAVVEEFSFETGIKNVHGQFRQIRKLANGHYLIPLMGKGEVVEMDTRGNFLKQVKCGGTPFSVSPLAADRWLVSCGDGHNLVEIDWNAEKVIRVIDGTLLKGCTLFFVAEAVSTKGGNILFCNWNGHTKDKSQPLLVEMDNRGNIVWSYSVTSDVANVSSVFYFEK